MLCLPFSDLSLSSGGRSTARVCACACVTGDACMRVAFLLKHSACRKCEARPRRVRVLARAVDFCGFPLSVRALPAPGFSRLFIRIHPRITSSGLRNKSHVRRQLDCSRISWLIAGQAALQDGDLLPRDTGFFARYTQFMYPGASFSSCVGSCFPSTGPVLEAQS